jgi:hypothetical protein
VTAHAASLILRARWMHHKGDKSQNNVALIDYLSTTRLPLKALERRDSHSEALQDAGRCHPLGRCQQVPRPPTLHERAKHGDAQAPSR